MQFDLGAILPKGLLQMQALAGGTDQRGGLRGVELQAALATAHQMAIALCGQPEEVRLGGDAAIHGHQRPRRGVQALEHPGLGLAFSDAAGEDLGAPYNAAAIEYQTQGDQRTTAAVTQPAVGEQLRARGRYAPDECSPTRQTEKARLVSNALICKMTRDSRKDSDFMKEFRGETLEAVVVGLRDAY